MSKKKKSFTVEEIREYQEVRTERNFLVHGEIRDLKNQVVQAEKNLRGAKEKLAAKELRLKELTATLKKYNDLENSGVIPQAEPQKKTRQPKIKEEIKNMILMQLVSEHMEHDGSDRISLKTLAEALGNYFDLHPKSVSNFFSNQFKGEELVGGSKNRALKLPLKTKHPKYSGEVRLMVNRPEGLKNEQVHIVDDSE